MTAAYTCLPPGTGLAPDRLLAISPAESQSISTPASGLLAIVSNVYNLVAPAAVASRMGLQLFHFYAVIEVRA